MFLRVRNRTPTRLLASGSLFGILSFEVLNARGSQCAEPQTRISRLSGEEPITIRIDSNGSLFGAISEPIRIVLYLRVILHDRKCLRVISRDGNKNYPNRLGREPIRCNFGACSDSFYLCVISREGKQNTE